MKPEYRFGIGVFRLGQGDPEGQAVSRVEPGINAPELHEAPGHKAGPHQENQSKGHLGYHQNAPSPVPLPPAGGASATLFEGTGQVRAGVPEDGEETE